MNNYQQNIANLRSQLVYPISIWLLSRGLICLGLVLIATLLPEPPGGIKANLDWSLFTAWDSGFYQGIATNGYGDFQENLNPSVAFFPLFPCLINLVMKLGLSFPLAGILVNNFSFLLTLILLYHWSLNKYGIKEAQWICGVLALFPLSLYATVVYTEGLFLFLSTAALYSFERKNNLGTLIWGSLATATRVTGLALIPTFLVVSWREKRAFKSYLISLGVSSGVLGYSAYCGLKFNNPIAFLTIQKEWQPDQAFWGAGWFKMLGQIAIGHSNLKEQGLHDPVHPLIFIILCLAAIGLWFYRSRFNPVTTDYGYGILILGLWILSGDNFLNLATVMGGIFLLWHFRHRLALSPLFYGLFSLIIIFSSGRTASAERYIYGIVSVSIALGLLLKSYPRWGYMALSFFGILLILFSIRFAQHLWVA
jgi:Gpi18-like mannosyltransferase